MTQRNMRLSKNIPPYIQSQFKNYPQFYQDVWKACTLIPSGQTRSYGWIARQIGRPGAFRAVGRALGKNPFSPVVPCHRVIRSDGALGGYSGRGGPHKKAFLIKKEGKLKH